MAKSLSMDRYLHSSHGYLPCPRRENLMRNLEDWGRISRPLVNFWRSNVLSMPYRKSRLITETRVVTLKLAGEKYFFCKNSNVFGTDTSKNFGRSTNCQNFIVTISDNWADEGCSTGGVAMRSPSNEERYSPKVWPHFGPNSNGPQKWWWEKFWGYI